ncbi:MAG: Protein pmbA [Parcubacteria group bacterium GW2011_GWA2_47_7]|nr:MAG: Protein pmbA [Parcubacteria group bacterium GW2011_GWA2_47_7]
MNQKEMLRVGKQLLRHAKSAGATDAVVSVDTSTERSVTVRDGVQEDVTFSSSAAFSVTAMVGDKCGYANSSSFENDDLACIAKEAVLSAHEVNANEHQRLARPDEWPCSMEELPRCLALLDCDDESPNPTLKELEERAIVLDRIARQFPGISRSEGTSFGFHSNVSVLLSSNGFSIVSPSTQYSKSTTLNQNRGDAGNLRQTSLTTIAQCILCCDKRRTRLSERYLFTRLSRGTYLS